MRFGWSAPLIVAGVEQAIADFPRYESPWGTVERLETRHRFDAGEALLELDFDTMRRSIG